MFCHPHVIWYILGTLHLLEKFQNHCIVRFRDMHMVIHSISIFYCENARQNTVSRDTLLPLVGWKMRYLILSCKYEQFLRDTVFCCALTLLMNDKTKYCPYFLLRSSCCNNTDTRDEVIRTDDIMTKNSEKYL